MAITKVQKEKSEANQKWGWTFACDGVVGLDDAIEMMGGCGKNTLLRRVETGKIRMGLEGRRRVFCVRSIKEHLKGLEQ